MNHQSTTSDPNLKPKAKRRPPILSPTTISSSSRKLFSSFLRPARVIRQPSPPSLAWSKLPPPAAEIDERPTYRTRRFRLWKDAVPALRIAVLDPRKRFHLRRYQSFAVPGSIPPFVARRQIYPLVTPHNQWAIPLHKMHVDSRGRDMSGDVSSISLRPRKKEKTSFGLEEVEVERKLSSLTPLPSPPPTPNPSSKRQATHNTIVKPPDYASTVVEYSSHTDTLPRLPTPPSTPKPASPAEKRARKAEKEAAHQRLLSHKWVLDQEHERRFRRGMNTLMNHVMEFQRENTLPSNQWSYGKKWKENVDKNYVADIDIRKKSDRIYDYLDPNDIAPVPGRAEAHAKVKEEDKWAKRKKERKEKKKIAENDAIIANSGLRTENPHAHKSSIATPPRTPKNERTTQVAKHDTAGRSRTKGVKSETSSSASSHVPVTPEATNRSATDRILLRSSWRHPSVSFNDDVDQLLRGGSGLGRKRDRAKRGGDHIADHTETRVPRFAIRIEDEEQGNRSGLDSLMRRLGMDNSTSSSGSADSRRRQQSNLSTEIGPESSVSTSPFVPKDRSENEFGDPSLSVGARFGSLNMDDDTCDPFPSSSEAENMDLELN